jgi:hypothetical protein
MLFALLQLRTISIYLIYQTGPRVLVSPFLFAIMLKEIVLLNRLLYKDNKDYFQKMKHIASQKFPKNWSVHSFSQSTADGIE